MLCWCLYRSKLCGSYLGKDTKMFSHITMSDSSSLFSYASCFLIKIIVSAPISCGKYSEKVHRTGDGLSILWYVPQTHKLGSHFENVLKRSERACKKMIKFQERRLWAFWVVEAKQPSGLLIYYKTHFRGDGVKAKRYGWRRHI